MLAHRLIAVPRRILPVDGAGALASTFLLRLLIAPRESWFGMPAHVAYLLAAIVLIYVLYGVFCYFRAADRRRPHLKVLIVTNRLYAALATGLVIAFGHQLTSPGLVYFIAELLVIALLLLLEVRLLLRIRH